MTMPDGYESGKKPDSKPTGSLKGAVAIVVIVIIVSLIVANAIWGITHDDGASNVEIKADGCEKTSTGSIRISSIISNYNDFGVIVEWQGNGQIGYAKIPANTQVSDEVYSYEPADSCTRSITDVTRN